MTIQDYLINPAGKGSAVFGDQTTIKDRYETETQELISSGHGIVKIYALKNRFLIFHYQLKSKSGEKYNKDLHYDILFQVDTANHKTDKICDMEFQVYSNCPSFLYTYANLFYKKKLLIDWTKKLYEKDTLRKIASTRNAYSIIGYERSLYITALLIRANYGTMTCDGLLTLAEAIQSTSKIESMITSQSQMRSNFASAKDEYNRAKALQAVAQKPKQGNYAKVSPAVSEVPTTRKSKKTSKAKKI